MARSHFTSRSQPVPSPGVPRPSATTTAKPWSANHCEVQCAPREFSTIWACGPPYGFMSTGNFVPGTWPVGKSTAVGMPIDP